MWESSAAQHVQQLLVEHAYSSVLLSDSSTQSEVHSSNTHVSAAWTFIKTFTWPTCCCCCLLLQESLSLSHAATIVLSQLYQARLSATTTDPLAGQYNMAQPSQLAEGYDSGSGAER